MLPSDFKPGEYVEIQAGKLFLGWNGKRGYVLPIDESNLAYRYIDVKVTNAITSWLPHQLIRIDSQREAEAILGEGYFA